MAEDRLLNFIIDNIKDMRQEVNTRLNYIESKIDNLVTKDECNQNKENCPVLREEKKTQNRAGLVTAYLMGVAGLITAIVGAITVFTK